MCLTDRTAPRTASTPTRLAQDLQSRAESGVPYVAKPGLIVIESVTLENMKAAIERLALGRFFDSFVKQRGSGS